MQYRNIEIEDSLKWLMHEADSATTARGYDYFKRGRVGAFSKTDTAYTAIVRGGELYSAEIYPHEKDAHCTCPARYPCKHLIAFVFYISANEAQTQQQAEMPNLRKPPDFVEYQSHKEKQETAPPAPNLKKKRTTEEFIFQAVDACRFAPRKYNAETKQINEISGQDRLSLPDGKKIDYYYLLYHVIIPHQEAYFYEIVANKNFNGVRFFSREGQPMEFAGFAPVRQNLVVETEKVTSVKQYFVKTYFYDPVSHKKIPLEPPENYGFFTKAHMNQIYIPRAKKPAKSKSTADANPLRFYVTAADDTMLAIYRMSHAGHRALSDLEVVEWKDVFIKAKVENVEKNAPKTFDKGPVFSLSIFPDEKGLFKVKCRQEFIYAVDEKYFQDKLLAKTLSGASAQKVLARFPGRPLKTYQPFKHQIDSHGNIARRDVKTETRVFKKYEFSSIPFHKKEFVLKPGEISKFMQTEVPVLRESGAKIHIHKDLMRLVLGKKEHRATFKMNPKTNDIDWFDGYLSIEGMGLKELRLALKAYRKKEDYFRLQDGSWVSLDSLGIEKLARTFDNLGLRINEDGQIKKISRGQLLAIEFEMESRTDLAITNLLKKIRSLPVTRKMHPKNFETGFQGVLRDYQKEGVLFLESLYEIGIGGILADDMGLGKTIQSLTFIERLTRKKESFLTLIVGPLASISVWKKEAERFFPNLKVSTWHGIERKKTEFPTEGIVLTTYGTLSRDFGDWKEKHHFDLAILDEAQNLKNFRSLSSHAVRQTNTGLYFCLTGTPLENSVTDLWSLFDICFPGYLGTLKSFQKNFEDPHYELGLLLRKKIEPFVMRRTKDEVLKELPPITETLVPVIMTDRQKIFYEEARKQAVYELANAGKNYLVKMLPHLMKLRRIACHPEAGNPETTDPLLSGKFQHLRDILDEMESSSSAILIFSQFTDILKICGRLLGELGHDYHYLDGSTPMKKRDKMVNDFQSGEKSFFLISLRAGGTALTLHRADTVIHLDPWWNPAVEKQASDRVHRIGQKQKVFVYKLYSENSIEEKVLALQAHKKELFDAIFGEKLAASGQITRDQIMKLLEK